MWAIEIAYQYKAIVSRLIYDTENEATAQRNLLTPELGKKDYSNSTDKTVTLKDKYGMLDVVVRDVTVVRCYNMEAYSTDVILENARLDKLKKKTEAA